jgi:hypothetical protein
MDDMKKDWRATKFAVPDDHVEPLKARLEAEYSQCKAAGNLAGARQAARNLGRVRGIRANSQEILHARIEAVRDAAQEGYSTYVSFGASLALALGPTIWDWADGNLTGDKALHRTTRALSLVSVGLGTDAILLTIKNGALRGTLRGNLIVGTAVTITEVTWLLYEHGWSRAFYQPVFYEEVVGGVSSMGVGLTAGVMATAAASETGPWAPVIGTGVGVIAGTAAYIGGRSATRAILELVAPEMFRRQEGEQLAAAKAGIERRIAKLQEWPQK